MSDEHGHDHDHEQTAEVVWRTILPVTEKNVGVWIEGSSARNPFEFNVALVELARKHHFEINEEQWEKDVPVFIDGEPTFEMVEDLSAIAESSLEYLNSILPDGYYFDFDDGLCLFAEVDE